MGLLKQMEAILPPRQLEFLRTAGRLAREEGMALYLVGGPVRDLLLGRPVLDLDLVVEGDAIALGRRLARDLGGQARAATTFGTIKLHLPLMAPVDLATARREDYPHPGALPRVRPGTIQEDLARRDFTIHAMAVDLSPTAFGQLLDPFNGAGDLERRWVRVLHERSFVDDATRILRAVRYEQRLGFSLEPGTEGLLRRHLSMLDTISGDRVRHELERIFYEPAPERALERCQALGVLGAIYPPLRWPPQASPALVRARGEGRRLDPLLYFALLASTLAPEHIQGLEGRLNLPGRWRRLARDTVALRKVLPRLASPSLRPSQVFALLRDHHPQAVQAWALLTTPPTSHHLQAFLDRYRYVKSALNGDDLLALGVPWGPIVGRLLEGLLMARLDGQVRTREEEVEWVRLHWTP